MRRNRASTTAQMVAMWRTLADRGFTSIPNFRDPYAVEMLSTGYRFFLQRMIRRLQRMPAAERPRVFAQFDPIAIRVAVLDAELLKAIHAGCRQVVILGAGFDTRAWRLDALSGTTVFEVDHPATQQAKRVRAEKLPSPKARLIWTPVDFERDSLTERLSAAGHNASEPTVWIWEGVVMYLADAAVTSTLNAVRERSSPGSGLLLHYHEPSDTRARRIRKLVFSLLGEPQIGLRTSAAMRALVERARFSVRADLGREEQATMVGAAVPENDLARISRILVAEPR